MLNKQKSVPMVHKRRTQKPIYFPHTNPLSTGELSKELGIKVTNEFLIKKLKLRPLFENGVTCYWNDLDLIKQKLAAYFVRLAKK